MAVFGLLKSGQLRLRRTVDQGNVIIMSIHFAAEQGTIGTIFA